MYIFRWLMKHPVIILALYFLSIAAILFSMTGGGSSGTDVTETAQTQTLDLSAAPEIEPSTLTSALVSGDASEETTETSNTEVTQVIDTTEVTAETTTVADDTQSVTELSTQFGEMNAEELLLMAREAYWNNGLDESAQIYQQLIELNPDVVDYKGELGNVYWRQGFPKKAAELYAEISLPMIEEGNVNRVANMVGFIGLFFPEKATEIHNILQTNK